MVNQATKFDDLLKSLGTGKWNLIHFIGPAYWCLLVPCQVFNVVYLAPALNYTCRPHPNHNVSNIAEDSCSYSRYTTEGLEKQQECTEWDFDTSLYTTTLTSEFGLVCDKGYLRASYQSIYMFACIFGTLVSGYSSDKYGRKLVVVVTRVLYAMTCVSIAFLSNFTTILAFRFILGALDNPTFYTLGMEVCQVKHRSIVGIGMSLPWAFGMMMWGIMAYFIRNWRYLQLAVSLPILLNFPILYLMNESPRWLIVQGRHQEALKVIRRAARLNKAVLPADHELLPMMKEMQSENEGPVNETMMVGEVSQETKTNKRSWCSIPVPRLIQTTKMRTVILLLCLNLFISALVYSGLSLSGSNYSSDPYLYMVISGLMEVPGYTITAPIIERWGRKYPAMIGYIICGGVILSLAFIPQDIVWLVMTLAMLGKLAISGSFIILFVFGAELIPTEVRLQGIAMTFISEKIAATISSYITEFLGPLIPWMPSVIFGVSSFVASIAVIPLPETLGKNLPDTIGDLEGIWKSKAKVLDNDPESNTQLEKLTA